MGRTSGVAAAILAQIAEEERRQREHLARILAAGPPAGSGISPTAWCSWHRFGFVVCPGRAGETTCHSEACVYGTRCAERAARGQLGNGSPLPKAERPACGARTRAGGSCTARVVPGKKRCRLHGGLSTGPKTPEGWARIREAARRRRTRLALAGGEEGSQ